MSRVNYPFLIFWLAFAVVCFALWQWVSREISQRHHAPGPRLRLEVNSKFVRWNTADKALADLIYKCGEERRARKIAGASACPGLIRSTLFLAERVERAQAKPNYPPAGIHLPSTSTQEMENGTGKPAFRQRQQRAGNCET